jgi:predicted phage terminase large subunit-like protein
MAAASAKRSASEKLPDGVSVRDPLPAIAHVARNNLAVYMKLVHGLTPARHHHVWIEKITALVQGRLLGPDGHPRRRLLLIAPPGAAKSTVISGAFPPWYLGNHPDHHLLALTAGDTQSGQFTGVVKATMAANDRHAVVFPSPECRPDIDRGWSNDGLFLKGSPQVEKEPAYRSASYFEAVIGSRAHGIILDDPLTQQQAQSDTESRRAISHYDITVDSRLHPDAWVIAIMTRFSDFDLAAHFMDKSTWEVLLMPALGDSARGQYPWGQALWPERYSVEWLEEKRRDLGSAQFNCLPGTTTVALSSELVRASCRPYHGRMVEIATARGHHLAGTPNHPVLSGRGWVALDDLTEADHVFSRSDSDGGSSGGNDVDRGDATLREYFETVQAMGATQIAPASRKDFHGDGQDGQVCVVTANRVLRNGVKAEPPQPLSHLSFSRTDTVLPISLQRNRVGPTEQHRLCLGIAAATPADVTHGCPTVLPGFGTQPVPHHPVAGTLTTEHDACLQQVIPDGRRNDAVGASNLLQGRAIVVLPDRIVKIKRNELFRGDVFNLETQDHTFVANGILTHNCLFQADPTSMGGTVFKEARWFRPLPPEMGPGSSARERLTIAQFWDLAYSEKDQGDYTACVTAGMDTQRNIYILSVLRQRLTDAELPLAMVQQFSLWRPSVVGVEEPAYRQRITRESVEQLQERVFASVQLVPTEGKDKVARARPTAARAEAGKLFVDRAAAWYPVWEGEMLAFPLGRFKDQADATAGVCALLADFAWQDYSRELDLPFHDLDVPGIQPSQLRGQSVEQRFGPSGFKKRRLAIRQARAARWRADLTPEPAA